MKRIKIALKLFWFGITNPEIFMSEQIFKIMAAILEHALNVADKDRPFTTHLFLADRRIVSFWMYPGLSKNPIDRIAELIDEIEELKEWAVQPTTDQQCQPGASID